MRAYASLCDGIGAAHAAWRPLGWRCLWTSEIDRFAAAVVEARAPGQPNLGDMTAITEEMLDAHGRPDLLVGGTPCQSFSVAGLRGGLDDPRGGLALRFMQLVGACRPRWVVWENVPGVLSVDGGRAFGAVLGALAELGYGFAWRVLDARHFGVAQRRRRVFVVASAGDWRRAAAVLLELHCLRGDPPPRGGEGSSPASDAGRGASGASWWDGGQLSQTLDAVLSKGQTMPERGRFPAVLEPSERRPVGTDCYNGAITGDVAATIGTPGSSVNASGPTVMDRMVVRRLTPLECERLQGFPDHWTRIAWRGRSPEDCPDGPRYRSIGNSMAVPVVRWIGERIDAVEAAA